MKICLLLTGAIVTSLLNSGAAEVTCSLKGCTVDGKPFYPLGVYAVPVGDMPRVKAYGFNVVQVYGPGGKSDAEAQAYLAAAQANGLMVLFTLPHGSPTTEKNVTLIQRRIAAFKGHPALFTWYLADEPTATREKPQELTAHYRWIKETDPHHPVLTSNWGSRGGFSAKASGFSAVHLS